MTDLNNINNILPGGIKTSDLGVTGTSDKVNEQALGQEDFFELLVAQMKNQDPMEPQSNTEFVAQIAQFGVLDSVQNMDDSLGAFTQSMQSNQALQASALVGRKVLVDGNTTELKSGDTIRGTVPLDKTTTALEISIYNEVGSVVRRVPMGVRSAGDINFEWDGTMDNGQPAPLGNYTFKAVAVFGNQSEELAPQLQANIDSVTIGKGQEEMLLNVSGVGEIPLSQVSKIM